ncbi:MAG: SAM-dependent methyltransferase, partial [Betaproteobacteria bacterium]
MLDSLVSKDRRRLALGLGALAAGALALPRSVRAQERFSLFVPSTQPSVDRLISMSKLRDDDFVVDLGSGDGRIVFAAARANVKLRGFGVDIQEHLVKQSNEEAKKAGLADRVQFFHQNVFDADLSKVTVIYMWLFPELMRLLRPKICAEARPGTRGLTHLFDRGSWRADDRATDGGTTA